MAADEASPLRFPTAKDILGESAPSPPPQPAPARAAVPPPERPVRPQKHARRPSVKDNGKRAAQKKNHRSIDDTAANSSNPSVPAPAAAVKDGSVVKPKQTKSRNGCATCKAKRLKCGEEKPGCLNCAKRGQTCGGYKKQFQWRDYGTGANGQVKINFDTIAKPAKQATSSVIVSPLRGAPAGSLQPTTPIAEVLPNLQQPPTPSAVISPSKSARSPAENDGERDGSQAQNVGNEPAGKPESARQDSAFTSPKRDQPDPAPPPDPSHLDPNDAVPFPLSNMAYRLRSTSPGFRRPSPSLTDLMQQDIANENNTNHLEFVQFSMPDDILLPAWVTGGAQPNMDQDGLADQDVDLIGPIHPMDMQAFVWPSEYSTPSSPPSDNILENPFGQWVDPMPHFFEQPGFIIDHTEFLEDRFKAVTCGILSLMDGPNENPWRNLVWPLTQLSPGLYHALMAMAAFHSAHDIPSLRPVGNEHKAASIRHIRDGLRDDSMSTHVALATALALGFAEAWDRHTDTGNLHIMGAQGMVERAIEQHHQNPLRGVDLARLKFLCNAWVYMDVIARLTSLNSNDSNNFDKALWVTDDREMAMGNEEPGFGINFGMPIDARLDPLMGCAGTLFPMIGRVANLVRKVCRSQKNSPGIISQARDLMDQIEHWDPPAYIERPEDPTTDVQHALQTAEAYRYATLLHLHQAVPELPSPFSDEQYAQRVLQYLATVPLSSRTITVHTYPMMVGGCQASELEDREWVRQRWEVMKDRMRIGIIDKCLTVTEEVWRRKDEYEAKPARQRKLVATAELNQTRRRGGPPDRNGSQSPQPGRSGVVFSYVETDGEPNQKNHHEMNRPGSSRPARINDSDLIMGKIDMAYTVRGHLHWVGVMWDWGWEVLLG